MYRWSHPMNGIRVMGLSPGIHPTGRALLGTCATLRHSQSFMVFFFSFHTGRQILVGWTHSTSQRALRLSKNERAIRAAWGACCEVTESSS